MKDLRKLPEFKALESVYAALLPLNPESRRKVLEAIHALMAISAGASSSSGRKGPGPRKTAKK